MTAAESLARSLPFDGHIPVLAVKPQSIAQPQGETRMAEPFPHELYGCLAPEYFNLQGMKVNADALTSGLYIRRQGTRAEKILIR